MVPSGGDGKRYTMSMIYTYTGLDYTTYTARTDGINFTDASMLAIAHNVAPNLNIVATLPDGSTDGTFTNSSFLDLGFTSGNWTVAGGALAISFGPASITVSGGAVVDWSFSLSPFTGRACSGTLAIQFCDLSSSLQRGDTIVGQSGVPGNDFAVFVASPGSWTGVPAPIVGAGLPSFALALLLLAVVFVFKQHKFGH